MKMKKIFSPLASMLVFAGTYMITALYLFYESWNLKPEFGLMGISVVLVMGAIAHLLVYLFYLRKKYTEYSRKQYIWGAAASIVAAFLTVMMFYRVISNSEILLFYGVLVSIPFFYHICGIAWKTEVTGNKNILAYVLGTLATPFCTLFLMNIFGSSNFDSFLLIIFLSGVYTILFMLVHIVAALARPNETGEKRINMARYHYPITFIVGLFLPVTGLVINMLAGGSTGMFGDFSSPVFYVLAVLNGLLLMIPAPRQPKVRLALLGIRTAGYSYVLYFFIIFIPWMPIGLIGLLIILGIYILAPMLLALWQGRILWKEMVFLLGKFQKWIPVLMLAVGLLVLPAAVICFTYNDRNNLDNAVQYLTAAPEDEYREINIPALRRSIRAMQGEADGERSMTDLIGGYSEGNIPILSNLYREHILHNQSITSENLSLLESIFFDANIYRENSETTESSKEVVIKDIAANTVYDSGIQAYRTTVDLWLENNSESFARKEYQTAFQLPEGAYISDYYLYVGEQKKQGLLTDRRAAMFIYNKIVRTMRDPGLLHYLTDGGIELRVFPFSQGEVRQTGLEILHKQKIAFEIDGNKIETEGPDSFAAVEVAGAVLLSASQAAELPVLNREPVYHFVVDCSENSSIDFLLEETADYAAQKGIAKGKVHLTAYGVSEIELEDLKTINSKRIKQKGGFNLNLAVKQILRKTAENQYPIIIAVSENLPCAVFPVNTQAELYPESAGYYALNYNYTLTPYLFKTNQKLDAVKDPIITRTVSYQGIAVPDDGANHILLQAEAKSRLGKDAYKNAVQVQADYRRNLYKGQANNVSDIRNSFRAGILIPSTAFIVVETDAQEQELLTKQEKLLNGTESAIETVPEQSLSEPPFILILLLLTLIFVFQIFSKRQPDQISQ